MALTKDQFAEQIRHHRALQGLNQADVAKKVGVELRTYQRWESGKKMPYKRNVKALAEALDVDIEVLTGTLSTSDTLLRIEQGIADNNRLLRQAIVNTSSGLSEAIAQQNDQLARQAQTLEQVTQALARVEQLVQALRIPEGTTLQDYLAQTVRDASAAARGRERAKRS